MRRPALAALLLALLLAEPAPVDSRAKKRDKKPRRGAEATAPGAYEYDASGCSAAWERGPERLRLGRCDFDEVDAADFSPGEFTRRFSLRRPLVVRNSSANRRARDFLAKRCEVLRRYGSVGVDLGDPFSLAKQGRTAQRMSLGAYLELDFSPARPLYMFDRGGSWTKSMGAFDELLEHPPSVSLAPQPQEQIIFAIGRTGSGIGFHQHADAWNQVLVGEKRWTVYPRGVPPSAGYNPSIPHATWLATVLPTLSSDAKPMECMQGPGDIVYVPSGWVHATINVGDTAAIALQARTYAPQSARFKGNLSKVMMHEAKTQL